MPITPALKIETARVYDLIPYAGNSKEHPNWQIEQIVNSIEQFGMNDPIAVWTNDIGDLEIIEGHGRLMACKRLDMDTVPIIRLDHLDDDARRAYVHVHNQLTMNTGFNLDVLQTEMESLSGFEWGDLGFELPDLGNAVPDLSGAIDEILERPNERERTFAAYNMDIAVETAGAYEIPVIKPCDITPDKLMGFNYVLSSKEEERPTHGVHFFVDDYQFERVWNTPEKYLDILRQFKCVLTPDFSLYTDMDLPVQIWNVYRSRLLGAYWQSKGITVVPTLQWSSARSFDFVFDGLPQHSTVAVSATGANGNRWERILWTDGMDEAIERLEPARILVYGGTPDYEFPEGAEIIQYDSFSQEMSQRIKEK